MSKYETLGISPDRLNRIRPAVEKHIGHDRIAGAVTLLARRGEVFHLECYGKASREEDLPMTEDSIFRIYSMTKPITCVALLSLYERGEFQLTTPVSDFIPGIDDMPVCDGEKLVEQNRQMAIWHLLTHTAGFAYPGAGPKTMVDAYQDKVNISNSSLADLVDGLLGTPLLFQPGTQFQYGFSQDVAARLVEIVSGRSFDRYLQEEIFDPLEMTDTGFWLPEEKTDRLTSMYGMLNIDRQPRAEEVLQAIEERQIVLLEDRHDNHHTKPHNNCRGGHGLVSTVRDYYRFCEMLLGKGRYREVRILGRKTAELMCMNHLPPEALPYEIGGTKKTGEGYGLGVRVVLDPGQAHVIGSIGELGWGGAASTYFWVDSVEEFIGIQMAQFQPAGTFTIGTDFRVAAYQAIVD